MKTTTRNVEKVELALSRGEFKENPIMLNGLVALFNEARWNDERTAYWRAIKQAVQKENPAFFGGKVPWSVMLVIYDICNNLEKPLRTAYEQVHEKMGFLPISITGETDQRWPILTIDKAISKQMRSIKRKLTIAYKSGGWDGEMRSAPMFFNQPVLDAPTFTEVFE